MSEEEGTLKNVAPTWLVLSGHQHQVGVDKHGDLKKTQMGIKIVHQDFGWSQRLFSVHKRKKKPPNRHNESSSNEGARVILC